MLNSILSFPQGTALSALAIARWRVYFLKRGLCALTAHVQQDDQSKRAEYQRRLAAAEAELEQLEASRIREPLSRCA